MCMTNVQPVDFKAVAAKGAYVYCYLSTSGDPYYIGMATLPDGRRPYQKHDCPLPSYDALIRVLRSGLTKQEAWDWEKFFIKRYGRKTKGGLLMNQNEGGEGNWGYEHTEETKAHLRKACIPYGYKEAQMKETATRYGEDAEEYKKMPYKDRQAFRKWERRNLGGSIGDWRKSHPYQAAVEKSKIVRETRSAKAIGATIKEWQSLSRYERNSCKAWLKRNGGTFKKWANRKAAAAA